ncbi:MAG TPA: PAS domain-containing protein [bacterium]
MVGNSFHFPETNDSDVRDPFSGLPVAVHVMTEDGRIVMANKAFQRLFGAKRDEVIGKHVAVLNNDSVAANLRLLDRMRSEIGSAGYWRGTIVNRRFDGTLFSARADVRPFGAEGRRYLVCFQEQLLSEHEVRVPCRAPAFAAVPA